MSSNNPPSPYVPSTYNPNNWNKTTTTSSGITLAQLNTILTGYTQYPTTQGAITLANGSLATTQSAGDNSTKVATTKYVYDEIGFYFSTPVVVYYFTAQYITINPIYRQFDITIVGGGGNPGSYVNGDVAPLALGGAGGGGGGIYTTGIPIPLSSVANQIAITSVAGGGSGGGFTRVSFALNNVAGVGLGQANCGGDGANPSGYSAGAAGGIGGSYSLGSNPNYNSQTATAGSVGGVGTATSTLPIPIPSAGQPPFTYQSYGKGGTNQEVQGYLPNNDYYNLTGNSGSGGYVKITYYPYS
jgi:hypothetical protein